MLFSEISNVNPVFLVDESDRYPADIYKEVGRPRISTMIKYLLAAMNILQTLHNIHYAQL
jgi:hypothetical protein